MMNTRYESVPQQNLQQPYSNQSNAVREDSVQEQYSERQQGLAIRSGTQPYDQYRGPQGTTQGFHQSQNEEQRSFSSMRPPQLSFPDETSDVSGLKHGAEGDIQDQSGGAMFPDMIQDPSGFLTPGTTLMVSGIGRHGSVHFKTAPMRNRRPRSSINQMSTLGEDSIMEEESEARGRSSSPFQHTSRGHPEELSRPSIVQDFGSSGLGRDIRTEHARVHQYLENAEYDMENSHLGRDIRHGAQHMRNASNRLENEFENTRLGHDMRRGVQHVEHGVNHVKHGLGFDTSPSDNHSIATVGSSQHQIPGRPVSRQGQQEMHHPPVRGVSPMAVQQQIHRPGSTPLHHPQPNAAPRQPPRVQSPGNRPPPHPNIAGQQHPSAHPGQSRQHEASSHPPTHNQGGTNMTHQRPGGSQTPGHGLAHPQGASRPMPRGSTPSAGHPPVGQRPVSQDPPGQHSPGQHPPGQHSSGGPGQRQLAHQQHPARTPMATHPWGQISRQQPASIHPSQQGRRAMQSPQPGGRRTPQGQQRNIQGGAAGYTRSAEAGFVQSTQSEALHRQPAFRRSMERKGSCTPAGEHAISRRPAADQKAVAPRVLSSHEAYKAGPPQEMLESMMRSDDVEAITHSDNGMENFMAVVKHTASLAWGAWHNPEKYRQEIENLYSLARQNQHLRGYAW